MPIGGWGEGEKNAPITSGRWLRLVFPAVHALVAILSYAPTSRHRNDAGGIVVVIISVIQAVNRFHISRKHTTAVGMRQARANKIPVKE